MKEKLMELYATLGLVETKGESTMIMADCMRFVKQCIVECDEAEKPQKAEE